MENQDADMEEAAENTRNRAKMQAEKTQLSANWKSALCVTSLYDSYIQLQQQNDTLREEMHELKHTNDLLAKENQLRRPEKAFVSDEQSLQEIRLLRAEKAQIELVLVQQKQQLEAQLHEYKTLYRQQVDKYQLKYALDPNEPKRVTLSMQTLQQTLENAVHEKDEMTIKYEKLQKLYKDLQTEHMKTKQMLQDKLNECALQTAVRAKKRIVEVLSRWSINRLQYAWKQWNMAVHAMACTEKEKALAKLTREKAEATVAIVQAKHAALLTMRLMQTSIRYAFQSWRDAVRYKISLRCKSREFCSQRSNKNVGFSFRQWKGYCRRRLQRRKAAEKVACLIGVHMCRRAMRTWSNAAFVRHYVTKLYRQEESWREKFRLLSKDLEECQAQLEHVRQDYHDLSARFQTDTTNHNTKLLLSHTTTLELQNRLGEFFRKQNDRQLLKRILKNWKCIAEFLQSTRQRAAIFEEKIKTKKLRNGISEWHIKAQQRQRCIRITRQVLTRMRQGDMFRCYNAWKEFIQWKQEKLAIAKRALCHMIHRQLILCMFQWNQFRSRRKIFRRMVEIIIRYREKQLQQIGYEKWKHYTALLREKLRRQELKEVQRMWKNRLVEIKKEMILVRQYFLRWYQHLQTRKKREQMSIQSIARWTNNIVWRMFESWKRFAACKVHQREQLRRCLRKYSIHLLLVAWRKWERCHNLKSQYDLLLNAQTNRDARMKQLEDELSQCRESVAEYKHKYENEVQELERQLLDTNKRQYRYSQAMIVLCTLRIRQRILDSCFKAWLHQSKRWHCIRVVVASLLLDHKKRVLRQVVNAWKAYQRHQTILRLTFGKMHSYFRQFCVAQSFTAWREITAHNRTVRKFTILFLKKSDHRIVQEAFHVWIHEIRKIIQLKKAMSILVRSIHTSMMALFTRWSTFTKIEREKLEQMKRAHRLIAIQAKVCLKWSSCSLRTVFHAWKAIATVRKALRRAEQSTAIRQRMRVMSSCFSLWQLYTRQCHAQYRWLNQWVTKLQKRRTESVFTKWKMWAFRMRQRNFEHLQFVNSTQLSEIWELKKEIELLQFSMTENKQRMEELNKRLDQSSISTQQMDRHYITYRHFSAWKYRITLHRSQNRFVRCISSVMHKRKLMRVLAYWKNDSQRNCEVYKIIEAKERRWLENRMRVCFRSWSVVVYKQQMRKAKQSKVEANHRKYQLKRCFFKWCHVVYRDRKFKDISKTLEGTLRRYIVKNAFKIWAKAYATQKQIEAKEHEKQKRIMAFLLGRHEWDLNCAFQAWASHMRTKRALYVQASLLCRCKCLKLVRCAWETWIRDVLLRKEQRQSLQIIQKVTRKYYLRNGLSCWRQRIFRDVERSLADEKAILLCQLENALKQLELKTHQIQEVQRTFADLEGKLQHTESQLAITSSDSAHRMNWISLELQRTKAICRIIQRQQVAPVIILAFTRWKCQIHGQRSQQAALQRLGRILQRRRREFAFWTWKMVLMRMNRWLEVQHRTRTVYIRSILFQWKQWTTRSAKIKRILLRQLYIMMHRQQSNGNIIFAFQLWKIATEARYVTNQVNILRQQLKHEEVRGAKLVKRLKLGKWCWRAYYQRLYLMTRFFARCKSVANTKAKIDHEHTVQTLQSLKEKADSQELLTKDALVLGDQHLLVSCCHGFQTLLRRLNQVTSLNDLFAFVINTFAQVIHGSSAILLLLDPCSNQLWTQRDDAKTVQVSALLGIAGYSLSSGSALFVEDISTDMRFHPMIDQLVVAGLSMDDLSTVTLSTPRTSPTAISLFSSPIAASDGAMYGVLQIAFPKRTLSPLEWRMLTVHVQLLGRSCCLYVEQLLYGMLRHCRDRIRSRSPDKFAKLFKQNKNWRKYYMLLERKVSETQEKLRTVLQDHENLIEEKARIQDAHKRLHQEIEDFGRKDQMIATQIAGWKRKMIKLKLALEAKNQQIAQQEQDRADLSDEFAQYRREQRAKELQMILEQSSASFPRHHRYRRSEQNEEVSNYGVDDSDISDQLDLSRVEKATLNNQLGRAEADNLLLVRALDMASKHNGNLTQTMRSEVNRVATRVKQLTI